MYIYIYICRYVYLVGRENYPDIVLGGRQRGQLAAVRSRDSRPRFADPNRPTEARPISLLRLSLLRFLDSKLSGRFPMDMRIPPLETKILLESNPRKPRILVRRLAVERRHEAAFHFEGGGCDTPSDNSKT